MRAAGFCSACSSLDSSCSPFYPLFLYLFRCLTLVRFLGYYSPCFSAVYGLASFAAGSSTTLSSFLASKTSGSPSAAFD